MNKTCASELWGVCNDLDAHIDTLDALLGTMSVLMETLECDAASAEKDTCRALFFAEKYQAFSRLLFAVLNVLQSKSEESKGLINKALDIAIREMEGAK